MNSPLLKLDLGFPPGFAFESWIPEHVLVDHSFVQRNVHRVSEGKPRTLTSPSSDPGASSVIHEAASFDKLVHYKTFNI